MMMIMLLFLLLFYPRNLTLKFVQNRVTNRKYVASVVVVVVVIVVVDDLTNLHLKFG